ncbi:hypothetical protein [Mycolicibacterium elephantis]|uniref:Uncharacterized protein n=1 Tax=Mycolicibacterium elephantis DSM 44368 TaxID=1335622 RepID=A0A439DV13_9MYCO|nr:hypothetical protein [Mycolicibacterium elephantis]MCV7220827.1 hypothetical protein [Mycolicibacterium elephantis]RWA20883.1 hypothetical protein MELE44368_02720 [Mycolicibacterium elephantis DSM 44368]
MARRGSDSGGAAAFFGVLVLIWVVINYYWVIVGVGAAIGLFFGIRALIRREQERRLAAEREAEILAYRADRQHRWALRGDTRGVYGVEGAELMKSITPQPDIPPAGTAEDEKPYAAIAYTAEDLDVLLRERPTGWTWAAFVSVLVQRYAKVRPRLRDCELNYSAAPIRHLRSGWEVAAYFEDCVDDVCELTERLESFMHSPAFKDVIGFDDEDLADADGILHVANRMMDFHERFVELAERCRDVSVPSAYSGLLTDCTHLMGIPLDGFRACIDELVEIVEGMPDVLRHAPSDDVYLGAVVLEIVADDRLMERICKQIEAAARD